MKESQFKEQLEDLLVEAEEGNVNVAGGWDIPNPKSEKIDWTVEIYEISTEGVEEK